MRVPNPRMSDPERVYPKIEWRYKCLEVALLVNINSNIIWNWKNNYRGLGY